MWELMTKVNKRFKFDLENFGNDVARLGSAYLTFGSWMALNVGSEYAMSVEVDREPRRNPFSRRDVVLRAVGMRQTEKYYINGGEIILTGFGNPSKYPISSPNYKKIDWEGMYCAVVKFDNLDSRIADRVAEAVKRIFVTK